MSTTDIAANIDAIRQRVRLAAAKYQRELDEITILAVSKTRPAEDVERAVRAGLDSVGESYLQEAVAKVEALPDLPVQWHFIGPIQSNKTRPIAAHFDWVHSVDRLKIARRLSEQRPAGMPPLQVCLQVNISGEASKSGVSPKQLPALAEAVSQLPNLQLRGLMAIPAPSVDEAVQRAGFAQLRLALLSLRASLPDCRLDTLSMGMSGDLEAAIAEGSTMVRVGTAIFGPRPASPEPPA